MLGAVLITVGGIYLMYRAYHIGVKKEISTKDNHLLDADTLKDPDGYCKFISRIYNVLGLITFVVGIISFMNNYFFKLGWYLYLLYGGLIVVFIIASVIISKGMNKFY